MIHKIIRLNSIVLGSLALSSCVTLGPEFESPDLDLVETYQAEGFTNAAIHEPKPEHAASSAEDTETDALNTPSIWDELEDKELIQLINLAVSNNTDVQIAMHQLLLANNLNRNAQLDRLPQPLTTFSATEKRDSESKSFPAEKNGGPYQDYQLQESITLEIDWIGRLKRLNQSAQANVLSVAAQLEQVQMITLAAVVRNYCLLRGTQAQLQATQANAARQKDTWQLTQSREEAGVATPVDVARAKSQYYSTLATIPPLENQLKQALHRLAMLTGQSNKSIYRKLYAAKPMPVLPAFSNQLLDPKALLARRPDVQAAEANLRKRVADIGVNKALWFPQISLLGDIGFASENFNRLGEGESIFNVFGVSIRWAALGFNRVNLKVSRAQTEADIAYTQYKKAVLIAFEEVENSLVNFQTTQSITQRLMESANAAKKAAKLAQERYEGGVIGFIEVLDAERRQLEIENKLAGAETQAALAMVNLYLSLARA